ncbi:MAG TPA: protein kinase, partial [Acidimicrobiales bacterium]|nr:protein kinase [Acidimicrobiales bacterium]
MTLFADRYALGPLIGAGGMAEVHEAVDTRLDRPVAIKLLRRDLAHDVVVRSRFETEARLAARLIHPNVVAVFDSGDESGRPYIVMERLPGGTLAELVVRGPLPEADARQLADEILAAVGSAHAAGILHR